MHLKSQIEAYFAEDLDPSERAELFAHLRECESCRSYYDQIASTLRVVAGSPISGPELRQAKQAVTAPPVTAEAAEKKAPAIPLWLNALAGALAIALVALLFIPGDPPSVEPKPTRINKGGGPTRAPLVDLDVVAIRAKTDGSFEPRAIANGGRVRKDEFLQFRLLNKDTKYRYVYLAGVNKQGQILDYYPRPNQAESVAIGALEKPTAFRRSLKVGERHKVGDLWIYALFSTSAIERQEVQRALKQLKRHGTLPESAVWQNRGTWLVQHIRIAAP